MTKGKQKQAKGGSSASNKQVKKRSLRTERSKHFWYALCQLYTDTYSNMSQAKFLCSDVSGTDIDGRNKSSRNSFARYMVTYGKNELLPWDAKRLRDVKYHEIEDKLVHYIDLRSRLFKIDGKGLSWNIIVAKCEQWAQQEEDPKYKSFKASVGFISKALKRNGIVGVRLHGEGNELSDEERCVLITKFKDELHDLIDKDNVPPSCVYNADQTGLFFNKLPNRVYIKKTKDSSFRGVKAMKDKDRITLMVCTSASGEKVPMFIVGKSKTPKCFLNNKPPIEYTNQKAAWFNQSIMKIWILKTFWPHHVAKCGNVPCILILDNFSGHKALFEGDWLPDQIKPIFLPANVTSNHQPADMGMIAALKVGYKGALLRAYLDLFDIDGGYEDAKRRRALRKPGCKGLDVGGKATILDAMRIIHSIWSSDSKYAQEDGIQRCWRKAGILPLSWESDINNNVGQASLTAGETQISSELCLELCNLMGELVLKKRQRRGGLNCNDEAVGLQDSFVHEDVSPRDGVASSLDDATIADVQAMAMNWWNIEENEDIIELVLEEAIEEIDGEEFKSTGGTIMPSSDHSDEDEIPARPLLSYHDALEYIEDLRQYVEAKCPGSIGHMEQVERDIRRERILSRQKNQQPTLYQFFTGKKTNANQEVLYHDHGDSNHNKDDISFSSASI